MIMLNNCLVWASALQLVHIMTFESISYEYLMDFCNPKVTQLKSSYCIWLIIIILSACIHFPHRKTPLFGTPYLRLKWYLPFLNLLLGQALLSISVISGSIWYSFNCRVLLDKELSTRSSISSYELSDERFPQRNSFL